MRLVGVEFNGFRRFENAKGRLEGHVVAIVGPNEAGKTSLLRALELMSSDASLDPKERTSDPTHELPDEQVIGLQFRLEADDIAAVSDIVEPSGLRWFE